MASRHRSFKLGRLTPLNIEIPVAGQGILLGLLLVSSAIWLGGWVALIVIARSATATLKPADRIAFFRHFGVHYGTVSTTALVIGLFSGGILLLVGVWTPLSTAMATVAVVLVIALLVGVVQARRMTRLRRALHSTPEDSALASRVARGSTAAISVRLGIGILSFGILILAVIAAV